MKKLIVILSDVAQSGKTTLHEVVHGCLDRQRVRHHLVHTDVSRGREHSASELLETGRRFPARTLIDMLEEHEVVAVDLAVGDGEAFQEVWEARSLGDLVDEQDAQVTLVLPLTGAKQSELNILQAAEVFRGHIDYLVVRQPGLGAAVEGWQMANAARAMRHLGAAEVLAPEAPGALIECLEGLGISLGQALGYRARLPRAERGLLHSWELEYASALGETGDLLIPAGGTMGLSQGKKISLSPYSRGGSLQPVA